MTERLRQLLVCSAMALTLSAGAVSPAFAAEEDPYERTNRSVHEFNTKVDKAIFKPLAKGYRAITPRPIRRGITNLLNNLREPFTFVNALLQAKPKYAARAVGRFVVNSTVGIGGLFDQAKKFGMEPHSEDFGQTLAVWGVPEGPYLVLPFIGPSNPRDAIGFVVQFFGDPADIVITKELGKETHYGLLTARVIDFRTDALEKIDPLLDTADDPYVFIRSAYRQKRAFDVSNGAVPLPSEEDDIFGEAADMTAPAAGDGAAAPATDATEAPATDATEAPAPADPTQTSPDNATAPDPAAPDQAPTADTPAAAPAEEPKDELSVSTAAGAAAPEPVAAPAASAQP